MHLAVESGLPPSTIGSVHGTRTYCIPTTQAALSFCRVLFSSLFLPESDSSLGDFGRREAKSHKPISSEKSNLTRTTAPHHQTEPPPSLPIRSPLWDLAWNGRCQKRGGFICITQRSLSSRPKRQIVRSKCRRYSGVPREHPRHDCRTYEQSGLSAVGGIKAGVCRLRTTASQAHPILNRV
ncbi:hypothetical protein LZ30DRAFT_75299 [Colletotrichum cereale]|nr:hypothetical protein LZ30DRAFT_75299 [Colletotrichum cereale]